MTRIRAIIVYNLISLFMVYLARYVETDAFLYFIAVCVRQCWKGNNNTKSSAKKANTVHRRGGSTANANNNKALPQPSYLDQLLASITELVPF